MSHPDKMRSKMGQEEKVQETRYFGKLGATSFGIVWAGYFALLSIQTDNFIQLRFNAHDNLTLGLLRMLNYLEPLDLVETVTQSIHGLPDLLYVGFNIPREMTMVWIMTFPLLAAGMLSLITSLTVEYALTRKQKNLRKKLARRKK